VDSDVVERRRSDRIESAASTWDRVRLRTGHEISLVNVSGGGALVETRARLLPGTAIVLHVHTDDRTVAVRARVTRCFVCAIDKNAGVRYRGALAFADAHPTRPREDA
jgi:hypothetical protein